MSKPISRSAIVLYAPATTQVPPAHEMGFPMTNCDSPRPGCTCGGLDPSLGMTIEDSLHVPLLKVSITPVVLVGEADDIPNAEHDPGHEHETPRRVVLSEGSNEPGASAALHEPPERVSIIGALPLPAVEVYLPTVSQLEVDGQAIASRNPCEPGEDEAFAGRGASRGVAEPPEMDSMSGPVLPAVSSYAPAAVQVPAAGQETLKTTAAPEAAPFAGRGASVAVHVPPERERRRPFSGEGPV